jgi:1,4-alpha-glucan branching enzyme
MSVQSSSPNDGVVLATFRLPHAVDATTVHRVGEFNDWSTTASPMEPDSEGFLTKLALEPGRRYRFRYLLDGDLEGARWENDWAADDYVPNEFGGTDSVLDLTGATPPDDRDAGAAVGSDGDGGPPPVDPDADAPPAPKRRRKASTSG